ncbi:hypothetical protein STEG23_029981, partial [Scotinomys teguina]
DNGSSQNVFQCYKQMEPDSERLADERQYIKKEKGNSVGSIQHIWRRLLAVAWDPGLAAAAAAVAAAAAAVLSGKKQMILFYVYECFICIHVWAPTVHTACRGQRKVSDPLELELQMAFIGTGREVKSDRNQCDKTSECYFCRWNMSFMSHRYINGMNKKSKSN